MKESFWYIIPTTTLSPEPVLTTVSVYSEYPSSFSSGPATFCGDFNDTRGLGQFFLRYAYSTPAGTAYRLTYGVPKE